MPLARPTLGFVILTHRSPEQLLRLVRVLNRMYDRPPIACHHDFSQSLFDTAMFPENVCFVRPSLVTGWGKWSLVAAALRTLSLLYEDGGPDWFTLLSGADFPVMPARVLLEELATTRFDAYLDYREVGDTAKTARRHGPRNAELGHFESVGNQRLKASHYLGAELWLPFLRQRPQGGWRPGRYTFHLPFELPWHPYSSAFRCFYGDQWFTANRRVADILLHPNKQHRRLQRHLRTRSIPDETYYQTVILNSPGLVVSRDNRRYAKWNGGGAHPQELTMTDLDDVLMSGAHFARKFSADAPVLDVLEARLLPDPQAR